jgi:hypothetical protein
MSYLYLPFLGAAGFFQLLLFKKPISVYMIIPMLFVLVFKLSVALEKTSRYLTFFLTSLCIFDNDR